MVYFHLLSLTVFAHLMTSAALYSGWVTSALAGAAESPSGTIVSMPLTRAMDDTARFRPNPSF
jgi:hypothetical protein